MKILSAAQIRKADQYTISHEPIAPIDLMERAAGACFQWLVRRFPDSRFAVVCGPGNNGGDGLAIARMLRQSGYAVRVFAIKAGAKPTKEFVTNEARLKRIKNLPYQVANEKIRLTVDDDEVVIDALFGTGLARPLSGQFAWAVQAINTAGAKVVSVDMPSGLYADQSTRPDTDPAVVEADYTLSFQVPKLAFLFAENARYFGQVELIPIGLDKRFIASEPTRFELVDKSRIMNMLKPRAPFSHKGDYGHAAIMAGSYGKMGAAVLAVRACLRSGAGLTTAVVPACGYEIMQLAAPEAMCLTPSLAVDGNPMTVSGEFDPGAYSALGIGPGLGTNRDTAKALRRVLERYRGPMVLDADALNLLAAEPALMKQVPEGSVLTPHPKEFERLAGPSTDQFSQNEKQSAFSEKYKVVIVLKGKYTCVSTPDGKCRFNPTGNPGMAKGGTGDVLTGIITALLAQGLAPGDAAVTGVYVHGLAGDLACQRKGMHAMIASDLIAHIGKAIGSIHAK